MDTKILEWAPFRLAEGKTEAALLEASRALQADFLAGQPGFISRSLVKGEDGEYVDLVWWASMDAAQAAMARVADSPTCALYFAMMAGATDPGAGVRHFREVSVY